MEAGGQYGAGGGGTSSKVEAGATLAASPVESISILRRATAPAGGSAAATAAAGAGSARVCRSTLRMLASLSASTSEAWGEATALRAFTTVRVGKDGSNPCERKSLSNVEAICSEMHASCCRRENCKSSSYCRAKALQELTRLDTSIRTVTVGHFR